MSYSSCIVCKEMVSYYEKYCKTCVVKHNLKQNDRWHKGFHENIDVGAEIEKDKKK